MRNLSRMNFEFPRPSSPPPEGKVLQGIEEDVLLLLRSQPLYGVQICKGIEETSAGKQLLKIGQLYPTLHALEKKGLVTTWMSSEGQRKRGGNRRKYYEMTRRGITALSERSEIREQRTAWRPDLTPT